MIHRFFLLLPIAFALFGCQPHRYSKFKTRSLLTGIYAGESVSPASSMSRGTVSLLETVTDRNGNSIRNAFCTGTVIAKRYVLTAAHCFAEMAQGRFRGDVNAFAATVEVGFGPASDTASALTQVSSGRIVNVSLHPQYDLRANMSEVFYNSLPFYDIAVLELARDIPEFAAVVPLATVAPKVGTGITLVGHGIRSTKIRASNGSISPWSFATRVSIEVLSPVQFAYAMDNTGGVCSGDSGGPAYVTDASGAISVVGVTSFMDNPECGLGTVSISTSVPAVLSWIRQQMN